MLGLDNANISDCEIMRKILEAEHHDLDEVDFETEDGKKIRVLLPHLRFDEFMYREA